MLRRLRAWCDAKGVQLILDEVMAGLNDSELSSSVEMVRRARVELGVTVIWVEHVMKAVMNLAERILVLNFGTLI